MLDYAPALGVNLASDSQAVGRWATDKGGEYMAAGVGVGIAGFRASLGIVDDPYGSKEDAYSEKIRDKVWDWFTHDFSSRLKPGAKRVVMHTRMHMDDLAGRIKAEGRKGKFRVKCLSLPAIAGFNDPLGRKPGEYLWDEPSGYNYGGFLRARQKEAPAVEWASLYQQNPIVDGGNILKADWWQTYEHPEDKYPQFSFVIATVDPAYTSKEENDPTGFTIWGIYQGQDGKPRILLCYAFRKRLELHGPDCPKLTGETEKEWAKRTSSQWGLVEWIAYQCKRFKVDRLLIENKGPGLSVAREMRRLYSDEPWGVWMFDPKGRDKVARAHAVQHLFADKRVYAPDRDFARMVIQECAEFPRGKNDDLVDCVSMALEHLRDIGLATRREEHDREMHDLMTTRTKPDKPLYGAI